MMIHMSRTIALAALLVSPLPALAEPGAYDSPEAAVVALTTALETADRTALLAVFGPEYEDLIFSGDAEKDREIWGGFLRDYQTQHRIDVVDGTRAVVFAGREQWPFPAELIQTDGKWRFDSEGARDEVHFRRIGLNELDVIDLMHRAVEVQARFRAMDHDGDGVPEFAAGILSSPGSRDGLYWPDEPGTEQSPIGAYLARANSDGFAFDGTDSEPDPYLGYYFRILQKQGPAAPGGAYDYRINGNMVAGHALLAYPAAPGETGIMSFMVSEAGVVYQADLGPDTLKIAGAIDTFDPGPDWTPVAD